jgi:hypothetical protein
MATHPPLSQKQRMRRHMREALAMAIIVLIAGIAIGTGYLVANHGGPLQALFQLGQPTPIPTLTPIGALGQIQLIYANGIISQQETLSNESDLITEDNIDTNPTLTPRQQTQILELYMRGFSQQTFWRWTDKYPASGTTIVYDVHTDELWIITLQMHSCTSSWQIYSITPAQIIQRGVTTGDYTTNTPTHAGTGPLPDGLSACG